MRPHSSAIVVLAALHASCGAPTRVTPAAPAATSSAVAAASAPTAALGPSSSGTSPSGTSPSGSSQPAGATNPGSEHAAPPAAQPSATPPPASPPLPVALKEALDSAAKAIEARDPAAADKQIAVATSAAGDEPHFQYMVARLRAARFASVGDFERAAAAMVTVIPKLVKHPELPDEFWSHNALMMIREAQGDPAAALAENDQATLSAARGSWDPEGRETLAFQKDRWHRAYLTRMLAESRSGSVKQALVQYAEAALEEYRPRGFPESVAVLEAYFAALDGRRNAAIAAAKRVDAAKDDDIEDLYLLVVGLEAGGDHAGAEEIRRAMRAQGGARIARYIMIRWIDLDTPSSRRRGFTPWHASRR